MWCVWVHRFWRLAHAARCAACDHSGTRGATAPGMGLVNHVFTEDNLKKLYDSNLGIGHTRYATTGKCELENCQPFVVETLHGKIAVAHNGELVNAARLRKKRKNPQKLKDGWCPQSLAAFYPSVPDQMVYTVRYRCGQQLAIEAPVEADLVSTVPESATPAALGYATKCGLPYVEVLCKNRYVGRTFIQPNMRLRQLGVAKKFGVLSDNFKGKRIVLIDDSIVRGNTISPIIKLLKESGAKEVHIRVASPPIKYPCFMGINIPTKEELIANKPEFDCLAEYLGANSVVYLSVEGLVSSVQQEIKFKKQKVKKHDIAIQENGNGLEYFEKTGHCTACLTGQYPVELEW